MRAYVHRVLRARTRTRRLCAWEGDKAIATPRRETPLHSGIVGRGQRTVAVEHATCRELIVEWPGRELNPAIINRPRKHPGHRLRARAHMRVVVERAAKISISTYSYSALADEPCEIAPAVCCGASPSLARKARSAGRAQFARVRSRVPNPRHLRLIHA